MIPRPLLLLLGFLDFAIANVAQDQLGDPTVHGLDSDPYLHYRPPFVRSLPVQILLTGIVLTLVTVLLIHLTFTAQYHWPLAPVNYVLQLSGVTTLLISLVATLRVIMKTTMMESQRWPYMLSYIAVNVPPLDVTTSVVTNWSTAEKVTWLLMNAATSCLIQITHIHFLTLLYPSRLEGRLILTLLVPLALVAAVMQLIPIQGIDSQNKAVMITSALRNVCNATLSLLFTIALFIWGFLVNRRQAWRTDGGTAVFGTAALTLAVISTVLNFIYVDRETEYVWMPGLLWAVILWQSFLGWWWWVGAGSGSSLLGTSDASELVERLMRQEKREKRRQEAKERRRMTKMRAKKVLRGMAGTFGRFNDNDSDSATITVGSPTSSSINALHLDNTQTGSGQRLRRRRTSINENDDEEVEFADIEPETTPDALTLSASTSSRSEPRNSRFQRFIPDFLLSWFVSLRHAHEVAAHAQEVERAERIRGLGRRHPIRVGGWGLGSFGWRSRTEWSPEDVSIDEIKRGKGSEGRWGKDVQDQEENSTPSIYRGASLRRTLSDETLTSSTGRMGSNEPSKTGESVNRHAPSSSIRPDLTTSKSPTVPPPTHRPSSMWWWGPLRQWRLQDTTIY